ncbi:MAG TPA: sugar phosphate isomerase/epimerase [Bryobacteraceae bacterium]|nr:sugar phosphate isomerase/epimerase [Bryobacteraceae bacterium]
MQLGFVSAILPDLSLEEVLKFAAGNDFSCVEVMCWPKGKAERRYAGVTHLDVTGFTKDIASETNELVQSTNVKISGLGYYPNPLVPDEAESQVYTEHLKRVIAAAELLGLPVVNTFIGRDWTKSVDENWPRFLKVWKQLIRFAEDHGVKVAIEHCPMFFSKDEWPGGKNLAQSPAIWRRMFNDIPSMSFGLNFDPSHFIWQQMDYLKAIREFAPRIFHAHAKDARLDRHKLDDVGILAHPLEYHTPKIPGLGDVNWGLYFSTLGDAGYHGPVCIEVEDRAYEGSLENRKASLTQSGRYLRQFCAETK